MKKLKYLLILIIGFYSMITFSQNQIDSICQVRDNLIGKAKNKTLSEKDKKTLIKLVFEIQNRGFKLEENYSDALNSLVWIDNAIPVWIALKDTSMYANLLKFKGLLLGYIGKHYEAKLVIRQAISLYTLKNQEFGVAVSYFDLSKVYEQEAKIDSAFYFINLALKYWVTKNDTSRIIGQNIQLINLYLKTGDISNAKILQQYTEKNLRINKEYWYNQMNFYYLSYKINEYDNNVVLRDKYYKLYQDILSSQTKKDSNFKPRMITNSISP